ncbi:MAG: HEAT repeat domain-containing protein [Gemmatimonadota bacterium]
MTPSASIAANFAAVLLLLRDHPDARDEQAAAFRLLVGDIKAPGLDLRVTGRGLRVNGNDVKDDVAGVSELRRQLLTHGMGEVRAPGSIPPATLLELLRVIAGPPVPQRSLYDLGNQLDAPSVGLMLAPPAPDDAEVAGDWSVYDPLGSDDPASARVALARFRSIKTATGDQLDRLLGIVETDPTDRAVPDRLNEIVSCVDDAARRAQWADVAHAAATLVACEERAGDAVFGRAYAITLRRMLPRSVLEHLAHMMTGPARRAVLPVLQRMGADATEVLLGLLASAATIEERRAYYGALRQMTAGTELLINMLTHDDWFVVRNVADLCGELRIEAAVPRLTHHLGHEDERVRRAVAGALSRIGTASTVEPLRQALRDPAPAVRLQALHGIEGRKSRHLAMTLAVLLEEETHPDIVREMLLALGRIGSTEAVQALVRAAAPGGRLFNRKPVSLRLAAIEGLQLANDPGAAASLQSLLSDSEGEVRTAAQKALAQLNS